MKQLNIDIANVTVGSDPEFGVIDQHGTPRSIVGLIGGTKKEPLELNRHVSCQEDNVGAEICIPPCRTAQEYSHYINMGKELTEQRLQAVRPAFSLVSVSSQRYSDNELNSPTAQMFGCEPSYDNHNDHQESPRPSAFEVGNLRSFGFHVHIGYQTDEDMLVESVTRLITAMDVHLGIPSLLIDQDTDRRSIYGNPGDFRFRKIPASDGEGFIFLLEYRTLGGAMHATTERIEYVFNQTMKAVAFANSWKEEYDVLNAHIKEIFDTNNTYLAMGMCEDLDIEVLQEVETEVYA